MTAAKAGKGADSARNSAHQIPLESPFPKAASNGGWYLPQGQSLPEFALESGFLAPWLLSLDSHIRPLADLGQRTRGRSRR
jgi:hypothetical protein